MRFRDSSKIEISLIALFFCYFGLTSKLPELPLCPAVWFGGAGCPACGTTRAIWSIMHGRLADAWLFNPIGYIVVLGFFRRSLILIMVDGTTRRHLNSSLVDKLLIYSFFTIALTNYLLKLNV